VELIGRKCSEVFAAKHALQHIVTVQRTKSSEHEDPQFAGIPPMAHALRYVLGTNAKAVIECGVVTDSGFFSGAKNQATDLPHRHKP
jgi:hypothetical protein